MTLAQLYAGDGATTGLNGAYCVTPEDTSLLNVTTTLKDGQLLIEIFQVTLTAGVWVRTNGDLSVYTVLADGRIMTMADMTLDAAGNMTAIETYSGPCLFAAAGQTHVEGGGTTEWFGTGNPGEGTGTYYFQVDSVYDAAMLNGYTFQQYGDGNGDTENIRTVFANGVCTWSASQSNGGLPGATPVFLTQRLSNRV